MVDDADGKIRGKFSIFDDMLAFLWCKMNVAPKDTLLDVLKSFYKSEEIAKSRDLFFSKVPDNSSRRVKHRKPEDVLKGLYELMQGIPTEDPPVFVAPDLNNIPFINLSNIDGAMLVSQQNAMKTEVESMKNEQIESKSQLSAIKVLLESSSMRNFSTGTVANETVTTNRRSTAINQVSSNQ